MSETQQRIVQLIHSAPVVLFMKGTRAIPQCGFSATVVGILDQYLDDYSTVDVLQDSDIRDGIKQYANWPTIPQLYIRGEFVGGCDIIRTMEEQGELMTTLGDMVSPILTPEVTITDAAAKAFREACTDVDPDTHLRLTIDGEFSHDLSLTPRYPSDLVVVNNGIEVLFDRASARRANGLRVDFIEGPESGFDLHNPNAVG